MRILYLYTINPNSIGVQKKEFAKLKILNEIGIDARGIFFKDNIEKEVYDENLNIRYIPISKIKEPRILKLRPFWPLLFYYQKQKMYKLYSNAIDKEKNYDFILMRYPFATINLLKFLKKYVNKVVFEHNTNEISEIKLKLKTEDDFFIWNKYNFVSEILFSKFVFRHAKAIISTTLEILNNRKEFVSKKNKTVISNGIIVNEYRIKKIKTLNDNKLSLLFIAGTSSNWNGIDRLIYAIEKYSGNMNIELFILGEGLKKEKELVEKLHLKDRIIFTGQLCGVELDKIIDECHIAFGTLALHRKNMLEACPLKVREYLTRGIPFINAYIDTDLINEKEIEPFYLKVPADDSPIDMGKVIEFAKRVLKDKDHPQKMRNFALRKIDYKVKMTELKTFLEGLMK